MAAEAEAAAESGEGTVGSEVIEVTGSLVDRKTLDTPAPVSVVDREVIKASGMTNVGDVLQKLPAQAQGVNINFNNGGDGSTRVNIRGLGTIRTLVLLNGRRVVPGGLGADGSVDLNVIPLAVIDRVEVLKDGASAIYGSDAIGGVVNVITRDDFKGTEATLYAGGTSRGDGYVYDASFVSGAASSKANVVFSAGYSQVDPIFAGDRTFSNADRSYNFGTGKITGAGSTGTPSGLLAWDDGFPDPGNAAWDQLMVDCPSGACTRDGNNSPYRDFNFGGNSDADTNGDGIPDGDRYNFQPSNYLVTPLRRYNAYATGNYKLGEHIKAEFEALYVNRKSDQSLAPEPLFFDPSTFIDANSYYNPFGRNIYDYRRRFVESGNRLFKQNIDTFRVVAGLKGDLPEDSPALKNWKWEISYNYGRTQGTNTNVGSLILSHLAAAVGPSFMDTDGVVKCGTPTTPGPNGCVPLDILSFPGKGTITKEALKYLQYTGLAGGFNDQKTMLAQAHGQLAKTPWDGDIALAVGGDYRKESGGFQSDPLAATGDTTTNAVEPTLGEYNVGEGFAELSIVPVTNRAAAKYVELDGAARVVQYSTFGKATTWKASALYKVPQGLAVRGTYSTAFRAAGIGELFSGQSDNFPEVSDPCDTAVAPRGSDIITANCRADGVPDDYMNGAIQLKEKVGGNPALKPEEANVMTAGLVFEPTAVKGLALTLDYFKVKIDKEITTLGATVIVNGCYAQANRQYCDQIHRNAGGDIDLINDTLTNVGSSGTSGVDWALSYDHDFGGPGRFRFNLEGTVLNTYDITTADGRKIFGLGVYDLGAIPKYKTNFLVLWGKGNLGGGFNIRGISGFKECQSNDCSYQEGAPAHSNGIKDNHFRRRGVDRNITGDIHLEYSAKSSAGTTNVSLGVNNVMDQAPPTIYQGFYGDSDASTYDFRGRYAYVRLSQLF